MFNGSADMKVGSFWDLVLALRLGRLQKVRLLEALGFQGYVHICVDWVSLYI